MALPLAAKYLLLLIPMVAYAGGSHHHETTVITLPASTVTTVTTLEQSKGVALAIATAQHSFDWGSYDLQGSLAVGSYGSSDALSVGVAKRFDRILINGSVGTEDGKTGYGAAVNWRF